jgi:predicted nucleic acid-binding protein
VSGFLLDTNTISELRKGHQANQKLISWFRSTDPSILFLSVLVLGEIRKGIELIRRRDPVSALSLEKWFRTIESEWAGRILPVTSDIADEWGRLCAIRPIGIVDALLAATALKANLTLVTRNISDVQHTGVSLLNPF